MNDRVKQIKIYTEHEVIQITLQKDGGATVERYH